LYFELWGQINTTATTLVKQSVGVYHVELEKDPKPARWRTLSKGEKVVNMKLWFEKHRSQLYRLTEHEDDQIKDFEGHEEEDDGKIDYYGGILPEKGPGRKGKGKKGKGKKKSKGKKEKEAKETS
jgi:hypothetical protein